MFTKKKSLLFPFLLCLTISIYSQQGSTAKYEAMFIKNFLRYVEINGSGANTVIGVLGNSQVLMELQQIASMSHNMQVKKIMNPSEISKCQILYVPKNSYKNIALVKTDIARNVLIISEDDKLIMKGADLSFYIEDNKLKFHINKESLNTKTNIKVSSKLFALGQEI